jgi:hypothetical protein
MGVGVGETSQGFPPGGLDTNLTETTWCLYAWPVAFGKTGRATYFTNQSGDVLVTESEKYSGPGGGPAADAALNSQSKGSITGRAAIGEVGNDGNRWTQVN